MNDSESIPNFSSFFWAGFECTYAMVEKRERFDFLAATKHDLYCREDYNLIKSFGISTVREGLSWHQIDKGNGEYDFSRFESMMRIALEEGVEQIWDLNHFDYPENVDMFSETFIQRFSEYAKRCISVIRKYHNGTVYIVPINEISFSSWIGGDCGLWYPYHHGPKEGFRLKKQLVRASIAGMDAIRKIDTNVRFIQVDPFMRRIAFDPQHKKIQKEAQNFNDHVRYQSWDMLCGRSNPELGGNPSYLDIIGVNYYGINQEWIKTYRDTGDTYHVMIPPEHSAHMPFGELLNDIYERYHRPMVISETGSHGEFRPSWWDKILREIEDAKARNLPIFGVCAYPILDKPSALHFLWPQSGLFDFDPTDPNCERRSNKPTLEVITEYLRKW